MSIRELRILIAALEYDIQFQKDSPNAHKQEFKEWLHDSQVLLRKLRLRLIDAKSEAPS